MFSLLRSTLCCTALALLAACGGGGGDNATPPDTGTLPETACGAARPQTVSIRTAGSRDILSTEDYVDAEIWIDGRKLDTRIRGRGNSTWTMPKKPYRLKLDEATPLYGMPAEKDWALLANYSDKTMLRNEVAFCVARLLEMEYVPRSRYVELELNGEYQGLYQLTEHVETGEDRVDIGAEDETSPGFLVEWDTRYASEDLWFKTTRGSPYVVKSDATDEQTEAIRDFMNAFEDALYTHSPASFERADLASMASFYLVNELMRNTDAFNSSTFMYRRDDGPLRFGPVWDFDIAAGNVDFNDNWKTEGFSTRKLGYMSHAFQTAGFDAEVRRQWSRLYTRADALQFHVDVMVTALQEAQQRNFQRWSLLGSYVWPNHVVYDTYEEEVRYLKDWLTRRMRWLDSQYGTAP